MDLTQGSGFHAGIDAGGRGRYPGEDRQQMLITALRWRLSERGGHPPVKNDVAPLRQTKPISSKERSEIRFVHGVLGRAPRPLESMVLKGFTHRRGTAWL